MDGKFLIYKIEGKKVTISYSSKQPKKYQQDTKHRPRIFCNPNNCAKYLPKNKDDGAVEIRPLGGDLAQPYYWNEEFLFKKLTLNMIYNLTKMRKTSATEDDKLLKAPDGNGYITYSSNVMASGAAIYTYHEKVPTQFEQIKFIVQYVDKAKPNETQVVDSSVLLDFLQDPNVLKALNNTQKDSMFVKLDPKNFDLFKQLVEEKYGDRYTLTQDTQNNPPQGLRIELNPNRINTQN
jgi:hypothetical protein